MDKKDLKNITKSSAWKDAEFTYEEIFIENQMPLFHEPLTVEQIDENMAGILENCPQFFPALLQRGQYHVGIGKNSQAIGFYNRGFELMIEIMDGEELFDTVDKLINGLERHLRYDLCCRYLKRLIELYPKKALFYDYLAGSILQSKNSSIQEAITFQMKAIELEPENATFLSNLGWIHLTAGSLKDAEGTLKKALEIKPDDQFTKGNMEVLQYLKKRKKCGTFIDYLIRPVDYIELQQIEDKEEYDELESLYADYNGSRMAAFKIILLAEGDYLPHQISNFAIILELFFSFVKNILEDDFLFDDLVTVHIHFKPIMHKFIFKHKDVDDEIFEDIYMSLIAFYDFLSRYKLLDRSDCKEFVRDIKDMKSELREKMHRYNNIRHDYTISEKEKEEIREELFEGDHTWPFF